MMLRTVLLALGLCLSPPAVAQTDADRESALAVITQFDADTLAGDIDGILSIMPPRIMALLSATAGVDVADLRASLVLQTEQMLSMATIDEFSMDIDGARGGVTDTGRPYFLVPTQITMTITHLGQSGRVRATSDTLALEDEGQWWLMRVENPSHELVLAQAYPDLAGLEFAASTMEELQ